MKGRNGKNAVQYTCSVLCPICLREHTDYRYRRRVQERATLEHVTCAGCTAWCHQHSQVLRQLQSGRILAGETSLARQEAR